MRQSDIEVNLLSKNGSMTIVDHLLALRTTIIKIILGVVICIGVLSPFLNNIFSYFSAPLMSAIGNESKLISISVISPVLVPLKVLVFVSFCLALPNSLYQIWKYIAPGLYLKEKKYAVLFVISALMMFSFGVFYCYYVVFGFLFNFINSFAPSFISFAPDIDSYISFVLHMFFAFGLAFEMPVIVVMVATSRIVTVASLLRFSKYIVVIAFVVSAVITPPDVASQLLLAIPLIALYLVGVGLSYFLIRDEVNSFENKNA